MSANLDWVDATLADPADVNPVDCRVIAEELSKELRSARTALAERHATLATVQARALGLMMSPKHVVNLIGRQLIEIVGLPNDICACSESPLNELLSGVEPDSPCAFCGHALYWHIGPLSDCLSSESVQRIREEDAEEEIVTCECRGGPHGGYTCPACRGARR